MEMRLHNQLSYKLPQSRPVYVRVMFSLPPTPIEKKSSKRIQIGNSKKKKKLQETLLLLHVSKRMTNNNTMQGLAVVLSLAHVSGILVQTCGCSLGESTSHTVSAAGFVQTCEGSVCTAEVTPFVLISLHTFLYVMPQWEIRALCHTGLTQLMCHL